MPGKIWAYLIIILALIGLLKWAHYEIDLSGYNRHKAEISDSKDSQDKKEDKQVDTLIDKKADLKKNLKVEEKKIDKAKDKTGCADVKLIDMGFGL